VLDQQHALPEAVDAALLQRAPGTCHGHLLLEGSDAPALDAEDAEEGVPETLRFGAFRGVLFPLLRKRDGANLDLVPAQRHGAPLVVGAF
jgi:hypothetical protein